MCSFAQNLIGPFVFLIFLVVLVVFLLFFALKMPETKGKTVDEIADQLALGGGSHRSPGGANAANANIAELEPLGADAPNAVHVDADAKQQNNLENNS